MQLLYTPTSPYARKVRIAILERGLTDRVALHVTDPLGDAPELLAASPLGKVPVLVDAAGRGVIDSRVIGELLDRLDAARPPLRPADPAAALADRHLEAFGDGILDCALPVVFERRRPEGERSPAFVDRQVEKMRRALAHLAAAPPTAPGDGAPTPGVIAVGCALRYLGFRLGDVAALALPPPLRALSDALEARDSFRATAPPAA